MTTNTTSHDPEYDLFIDGERTPSSTGETIPIIDPATEESFASVAAASAADVDRAVSTARDAQRGWYEASPVERGRVLQRAANQIQDHKEDLAELLTRENGKPIPQSRTEVDVAAKYFEYYAGTADKVHGDAIPLGHEYVDYTIREPLGVVGHIVPWNFPVGIFGRTVAPALAVGNVSVVKPAEQTPLTAVELGTILNEAGVPHGVINVVPGYGEDAGTAMTKHTEINGIAFTGSVPTGKEVAATAARQLKPVHIEAGGKNPNVIFPDADLNRALDQTLLSIFTRNAGQVCSAGDRLIVHEEIHEEFVDRLATRATELTVGPGLDSSDIGALVSEAQYDRVREYIEIGTSEVGDPIVGGLPDEAETGYFIDATIFDGASSDDRISQEEIFGPVLSVIPFSDEREAIRIANDTEYGLTAGIFTEDLQRAHRFARDVVAGQVYVNEWFAGGVETPFGGFRQSGFGREKGQEAVEQFTQTKNVCLNIETESR